MVAVGNYGISMNSGYIRTVSEASARFFDGQCPIKAGSTNGRKRVAAVQEERR